MYKKKKIYICLYFSTPPTKIEKSQNITCRTVELLKYKKFQGVPRCSKVKLNVIKQRICNKLI